jgi:hypothetical protein
MMYRSLIAGCGSYLPERVVKNEELAALVDTSDEWIIERTGIRERHIAAPGQNTSDLALAAARAALRNADMTVDDIDLIILATATPDHTFPATATQVQAQLGMYHGAAFDVQAVCSGFIYALSVADNFIKTGQSKGALVIGAETFSRILDWEDRGTCNRPGYSVHPPAFGRTSQRPPVRRWRPLFVTIDRLFADAGQGSLPARRHQPGQCGKRSVGGEQRHRRRYRLGCTAPGEPTHPGRDCPQAAYRPCKSRQHRCFARQYLCRLCTVSAVYRH